MIQDRIKELRRVPAKELLAHPLNYRKHPDLQKRLLGQLLSEIGYADALLAYETPEGLRLIDGHLRAETTPEQSVPVLVLDVTEQEANKLLLTLDPLAGLAETDQDLFSELLKQAEVQGEVESWLMKRSEELGVFDIDSAVLPDLPSGDKEPFQSMTFTFSNRQAEIIKRALDISKGRGNGVASDNQNSNGNALAAIVEAYLG